MGGEQPYKTLGVLGDRIVRICMAKTHKFRRVKMMRGESWSAGEYLDLYGTIAAQLQKVAGMIRLALAKEKGPIFYWIFSKISEEQGINGRTN